MDYISLCQPFYSNNIKRQQQSEWKRNSLTIPKRQKTHRLVCLGSEIPRGTESSPFRPRAGRGGWLESARGPRGSKAERGIAKGTGNGQPQRLRIPLRPRPRRPPPVPCSFHWQSMLYQGNQRYCSSDSSDSSCWLGLSCELYLVLLVLGALVLAVFVGVRWLWPVVMRVTLF